MFLFSVVILLFSAGAIAKSVGGEHDAADGPLNLTPLIQRGEASRARELSSVDPTLFAGVPSHAAFITVNETNKWNTFFWFFPVQNKPLDSTPWIIWLQGGPGFSSLFGLFTELGPIEILNDTASRRAVTWGSDYSLLFIDNPIGAGFSYSETNAPVKDEDDVGRTLLSFIHQFVQVFPELQKAPLFVAGESYAGKYVPAVGHYLHNHQNKSTPVNLKGLSIGDGVIDPPSALHFSELALQLGFMDPDVAKKTEKIEAAARKAWDEGNVEKFIKFTLTLNTPHHPSTDDSHSITTKKRQRFRRRKEIIYSIAESNNYIKDFNGFGVKNFESFVNKTNVRSALHVATVPYHAIARISFYDAKYITVKPWLEELVEHYGVLCYSGQLDFIVAYAPSVHTYRKLKWSGADAYLKAPRKPIKSKHHGATLDPIGYVKGAGNFMEVMIRAAGHMAPADQPLATKQVLDMFVDKFK